MNRKTTLLILILMTTLLASAQQRLLKKEFLVTNQYLLFPIDNGASKSRMNLSVGNLNTYFDIRLASDSGKVDFWVYLDVGRFIKEKLIISTSLDNHLEKGFDLLLFDDKIKALVPIYSEKLRPQLHFSCKRGWNSDPNGLVYYDGEYHMFYQHDPFGWKKSLASWGHAVSKDLIHWEELPVVLFPDSMGMIKSGSAVVDFNNTASFQNGKEKVIVAAYTAGPEYGKVSLIDSIEASRQCLAYSNDRGRTFTKYKGNPVLPLSKRKLWFNSRDPKIFRYEPDSNWVMVLFEGLGHSIYTSGNLKDWKYESHVKEFWECPELFELPVDGNPENRKWVMYSASGNYKIGNFDGKQFIPETDKIRYSIYRDMYAGQTFNDEPNGRRIQVLWGKTIAEGMPFNQMITFPTELSLKTHREGVRMHVNPIKEISTLYKKSYKYGSFVFDKELLINDFQSKLLHIELDMKTLSTIIFSVTVNGYKFTYDGNFSKLNDAFIPLIDAEKLKLEFIIDVNSIEVYINDGLYVMMIPYDSSDKQPEVLFSPTIGKTTIVENLEVHELESIWK